MKLNKEQKELLEKLRKKKEEKMKKNTQVKKETPAEDKKEIKEMVLETAPPIAPKKDTIIEGIILVLKKDKTLIQRLWTYSMNIGVIEHNGSGYLLWCDPSRTAHLNKYLKQANIELNLFLKNGRAIQVIENPAPDVPVFGTRSYIYELEGWECNIIPEINISKIEEIVEVDLRHEEQKKILEHIKKYPEDSVLIHDIMISRKIEEEKYAPITAFPSGAWVRIKKELEACEAKKVEYKSKKTNLEDDVIRTMLDNFLIRQNPIQNPNAVPQQVQARQQAEQVRRAEIIEARNLHILPPRLTTFMLNVSTEIFNEYITQFDLNGRDRLIEWLEEDIQNEAAANEAAHNQPPMPGAGGENFEVRLDRDFEVMEDPEW